MRAHHEKQEQKKRTMASQACFLLVQQIISWNTCAWSKTAKRVDKYVCEPYSVFIFIAKEIKKRVSIYCKQIKFDWNWKKWQGNFSYDYNDKGIDPRYAGKQVYFRFCLPRFFIKKMSPKSIVDFYALYNSTALQS